MCHFLASMSSLICNRSTVIGSHLWYLFSIYIFSWIKCKLVHDRDSSLQVWTLWNWPEEGIAEQTVPGEDCSVTFKLCFYKPHVSEDELRFPAEREWTGGRGSQALAPHFLLLGQAYFRLPHCLGLLECFFWIRLLQLKLRGKPSWVRWWWISLSILRVRLLDQATRLLLPNAW